MKIQISNLGSTPRHKVATEVQCLLLTKEIHIESFAPFTLRIKGGTDADLEKLEKAGFNVQKT